MLQLINNSGNCIELTATPSDEWEFKEWSGDLTGTDNPKEITIDMAKTVKAVFVKKTVFFEYRSFRRRNS